MTDQTEDTVEAEIREGMRFSPFWLVPLAALVIGIWMLYAHWSSQGELITLYFDSGIGIEAGKTQVKRKNVVVGQVLDLKLTEKAERVALTVRIQRENNDLLREDTEFWVVRPRISSGGVSGLNTLLSGAYIEISPGQSEKTATEFVGLEAPPVTPDGTPGLHVTLDSSADVALDAGDPILFRGAQVGRIEYVHFNTLERRTYYNAFIESPYDKLITTNTRFWFSSGLSADLSADGIKVHVANLATLIAGGVAFDVPQGQSPGERVTERAFYTIYPNEEATREKFYGHDIRYIVLFDESIRGLRPGAPVEYRGVRVGEVLRTDIHYDEVDNLLSGTASIPVLIKLIPARFGFADTKQEREAARQQVNELATQGLRAVLTNGNLLTGQKLVELKLTQEAGMPAQQYAGMTVIPSAPGEFGELFAGIAEAIDKLNQLPLADAVDSADSAFAQTQAALEELTELLKKDSSQQLTAKLGETLEEVRRLANAYAAGSSTHERLQDSLVSLEQSLQEISQTMRTIRRQPNSLLFGGSSEKDIQPTGKRP